MSKKLKKGFIFPATSPDGKKEWNDYRVGTVHDCSRARHLLTVPISNPLPRRHRRMP